MKATFFLAGVVLATLALCWWVAPHVETREQCEVRLMHTLQAKYPNH